MTRAKATLAILLASACMTLAACGSVGDPERPGPLWGPDERPPAERAKEEQAKRTAAQQANKPSRAGSLQEVRDPASSTATISQQPIAGTNDPFGKPPQ
ncbi:MAG TPA: hypothetical protein VEA44_15310 [Caulobacter sp.]|nr:hypothetical protein [Caulobacter sp.]